MAKTNADTNAANDVDGYEGGRSRRSKLSENPVGTLASGFVIGAVLGAVIPASSRERKALQPVGAKVSGAARDAARQAAEQGRDKLNRLTGEVVTQVGSKVVDAVAPRETA